MTIADRYAHLSPLKRALLALDETKARLDAAERMRNEPVAIVGMGCRIPGAPNLDALWTLLSKGGTAVREVPADRWDIDAYYDPDPATPGRMTTRLAAFLDTVDQFDAGFFGIAPREAVSMDPQQRLLLEVVWEALEHAGIAPDGLSGTPTGVFVGVAAGDYADLMKAQGDACFDGHFASGIAHSVLSGRVSYLLGLQGPSVSIDTACSSSLVATHLACQSLRTGDCRTAIAGGVNLILTPDNSVLFSKTGMLASDGRCKTFDAAADGFVRGEGCGVVVLKRLSDAQADGDRIIAVIRGSAVNQDGASSSLTAPNGPSQVAVLRAALERAGMAAADIDYVEAHGTGTPLGDPIEVQALAAVHAGRAAAAPLRIGSLKTNVGHLEAAAGIAGLLKVVLSLQHEALPPHLNMDTPSPHIAWQDMPIEVVRRLTPWPRRGGARAAGVSSFGFSGTNAHVIVGEAPDAEGAGEAAVADRPLHVVALSARSESALAVRAGDLADALRAGGHALGDVAFTGNTGRAHHAFRAALVAASIAELQPQLAALASGASAPGVSTGRTSPVDRPRVAFLFTGQGAQYAGMARVLLETEPQFRQVVDRCDTILQPLLGRSIVSVLDPAPGEPSLIDETVWTQPALFVVDYALAQLWKTWGVEPSVVMGHSLGEVVAACVAGVFSLEDALTIVAARGRLMQQLPANGEMASVFAGADRVAEAVRPFADSVSIAAINEPAQTVVSGERTAVAAVLDALAAQGVKAKRLAVSHAFHSPLMAPMLEEFAAVLRRVSFAPPRVSIVSNVTGRVAGPDEMSGPDYWLRHVMAPVRFAESVATLAQMGVRVFVEAGPTPTLLAMAGRCVPEVDGTHWLPSLRKGKNDWMPLLESLARLYVLGVPIDWRGFDRGRRRRPLALPTYPFERERYWITPAAPRGRVEAAPAHPLLRRAVRIAGTPRVAFDTTVTRATLPWLFDHRVHGEVIVPGAAFVEMGFEAARARWGGDGHAVQDVSMHQVLAIDEAHETTWQVAIDDLADGRASFRVFTVPAAAATADWSLHAEGTIVRADRVEPAPVAAASYDEARARTTDERAPADHYQDLHDRGLDLGAAFRGMVDLRRTDGEAVARIELPAGVDATGYVLHPVLLDLAIQALGAAIEDGRVAAGVSFLPVALGRARHHVALAPAWVHAVVRAGERSPDTIVADIVVRASDGQPVASLEALRLKRADRAAMTRRHLSAIRSWFYEVQWQPGGRATRAAVAGHVPSPGDLAGSLAGRVDTIAREQGLEAFEAGLTEIEALSTAFVTDALAALGAGLLVGDRIDESALAARVVPAQRRLLRRLLEILGEDGLMRRDAGGWGVASAPPRRDVGDWLAAIQRDFGVPLQAELALLARCGPKLADVLEGRVDPLALLFPGGSSHLAENLYQVSPAARTFNQLLAEALQQVLDALPEGRTVRILEIGGGTGSTSSFLLPRLRPGHTEYVFTDVSAAFTTRAAEKFAAFPFVQYRTLDIERDPMDQGFAGHSFDVVVAANVLHATRDLDETFGHVRRLLAPEGLLVMLEMVRPQRWIDLTFGLTDGWWRFTDAARRPSYPLLGHEGWRAFLSSIGFSGVAAVPGREGDGVLAIESAIVAVGPPAETRAADASGRWLIVGGARQAARAIADRIEARGGRCTIAGEDVAAAAAAFAGGGADARGVVHAVALDTDDADVGSLGQLRACEAAIGGSALTLIQTLAAAGMSVPITFVTRGAQAVSADDAPAFAQAPLWGLAKVAALEHPELVCRRVDLDGSDASVEWLVDDLVTAGIGNEDELAFRAGRTWVPRLVRRAAPATAVPAAGEPAQPTRLHVAKRGAIDGLARVPAERRAPEAGEVELRVRVAALNFRDVMNVLGLYPGDPGPLGNECTGILTRVGPGVDHLRVGDEVVGLAAGCFADYVTAPAAFLVRRPPSLEAEDAVTLPIAYVTAYFALHHLAHMKAGDRVLIHAAAGGVGLAAVHLALRAGAEVFATAGSAEKQAHLASLGVAHVMSSRTPEFGAEILARTGRRGVDIVLNSLKGELIGASFDALADDGTFLEIGKSGWTPAQVAARGAGIDYHVIDWGEQARTHPDLIRSMIDELVERVATGELPSLPRTVFPIEAAPEAFRYMAQARHTGKVLLALPASSETTPLVRPDGSYLVTGGLNGLGWLTATWLAEQGARHLILMARSTPSADVMQAIADLERRGVQVLVSRGDVSVEADVEAALALAGGSRPPLRGIVHSAGVLDDGALMQQDWARFESVLAPKFAGAWNLDRSTRDQPLDFFVLYSSVAAIFGSRGQANHAAANTGMDALVHERRAAGRVGQSINWGVWSEVGAAVQHGVDRRVGGHGIGTIDPARGLAALEHLLRSRDAQTTVFPVDWVRYAEQFEGRRVPPFLSQVVVDTAPAREAMAAVSVPATDSVPDLVGLVARTPIDGRRRAILMHVRDCATRVLGLPSSRAIDARQPLNELGLDSLMAVELRNVLGAAVGRTLPATLLFDYPTTEALTTFLHDSLVAALDAPQEDLDEGERNAAPEEAGGAHVLDRIEDLSDEEVDRLLADRMAGKRQT